MTVLRIAATYAGYKNKVFPKLLETPSTLPEDKQKIKELLKKPWNSYIRRHSALTEKSTILKEHVFKATCRLVRSQSNALEVFTLFRQ
jgi:hypothetical protein